MRFITFLVMAVATLSVVGQGRNDVALSDLVLALANMADYSAHVRYAVTLPQAEDDIVYDVALSQPGDSDSYLIEWGVDSPSGRLNGFTAWYDGNFYSYRNKRLRELHRQWDESAVTEGRHAPQNSAQFASLLPSRLWRVLKELEGGDYEYKLTSNGEVITIDARRMACEDADAELQWKFDAATFKPLSFYGDYNPGAISSQQVYARYEDAALAVSTLSEETLRERYDEAFTLYRESQFGIEHMRGEQVPSFSLPRLDGSGRYTRRATEGFKRRTALVLIDTDTTLACDLIERVRKAVSKLPADADVIWACVGKNPADVEEVLGSLGEGETALLGARTLVRDCGAASLPVVLAVDASGRISDLVIGMNNSLESDVIQMLNKI